MVRINRAGFWIASLLVASCEGTQPDPATCGSASALVNAEAVAPAVLGVAPASVVAVLVRHQDQPDDATLCTGVRLDDRQVATAAHCFDGDLNAAVTIRNDAGIGSARCPPPAAAAPDEVSGFRLHPERDLAVIDTAPSSAPRTAPCGGTPAVGSTAYAVGYGLDEDGQTGTRRYLATEVVEVDDAAIGARAPISAGTCVGDSGGPLLVAGADGVCVAGTLFTGSADCRGLGRYVPLAAVVGWLGPP